MRQRHLALIAIALGGAACAESVSAPSPSDASLAAIGASSRGVQAIANGDGQYNAGVIVTFSMTTVLHGNGAASGEFRHSTVLGGLPVEFAGLVTCLAVDPVLGRAWIGGVVTENNSQHPSFTTPVHQVGRDIWFRVADFGEGGSGTADRSTFVGFEGGAGIITSAEYCSTRPWPASETNPNLNTSPLISGNLTVR